MASIQRETKETKIEVDDPIKHIYTHASTRKHKFSIFNWAALTQFGWDRNVGRGHRHWLFGPHDYSSCKALAV